MSQQPIIASAPPRGFNPLPYLIALLLYVAAALKLVEFLRGGVLSDPHFYLTEILFELILASALASNFARSAVIKFTGLVFVIFLGVTIDRALHGRHSCGCFGPVKVNPWITSILDASIVISIVFYVVRRSTSQSWRQGIGAFAVLSAVVLSLTGLAMEYFRPAHLLPDGKLVGGHGPIVCNPPSWYGKKLPLMRFIKSPHSLQSGTWLVVMYYHLCPDCQAEIRLIERHLQQRIRSHRPLPKVALVQIPPFGPLPRNVPTRYMHLLRMKTSRHWLPPFLPVLIGIHDGIVMRVGTRVPGQWFGFAGPASAAIHPAKDPAKFKPTAPSPAPAASAQRSPTPRAK